MLVNLQTNLKSLRFGHDRVHGGNSGQPYIQSPIPSGDTSVLPSQDFVLRGGLHVIRDSAEDVLRLGKYFTDVRNPSGLLFVAKQNLLSRLAVRTQASGLLNEGIYTPLSTLTQAGGVAFGLHVNKQGLNPFNGPGSIGKYEEDVQKGDNRLEALYGNKIILSDEPFLVRGATIDSNIVNILSYTGGPGSILGIGNTNIKFATNNYGSSLSVVYSDKSDFNLNSLQQNNVLTYTNSQLGELESPPSSPNIEGKSVYIGSDGQTIPGDFRVLLRKNNKENIGQAPNAPKYTEKNIENRVNLGDPGNRTRKNLTSYVDGNFNGAASKGSYDKITALSLYESSNVLTDSTLNDLVKFRIEIINNDPDGKNTFIHFRAFLDNISDSYSADWNATQYIGRGEKFYTYGGFDRKVSLSWTVAAQSKIELIPMYKKLNYLASTLAPDYSSKGGFMRGNLVKLTVGGYFYEQPGIITGLSYEIKEDSPWEIGINDTGTSDDTVKELPHIIRVSGFNFIPIHTFVPRLQQNTYGNIQIDNPNIDQTNYGPQRYISLKAINTNYDPNFETLLSTGGTILSTSTITSIN